MLRLFPPLAWMALIYLVSDRPDIPSAPAPFWDFVIKKTLHAMAYAILLGLWWRALKRDQRDPRRALLVALLITLVWAATDEWHQTFVPGRSGRARDVLIDGTGALFAAVWVYRDIGRLLGPATPRSSGARLSRTSGSADPPA
jgi:VanZ family protein